MCERGIIVPESTAKPLSYNVMSDGDDILLKQLPVDCSKPIPIYRVTGVTLDCLVATAKKKGVTLLTHDIINKLTSLPPDKWIYADVIQALIAEHLSSKLPLPTTPELVKWLAGGERGDSSNVVFAHMTGVKEATAKQCDKTFAPMDLSDMSRCLKLIDIGGQTWRDAIPSLATLSPEWEKIVARWDKLEALTRLWMADSKSYNTWESWRQIIKQNP